MIFFIAAMSETFNGLPMEVLLDKARRARELHEQLYGISITHGDTHYFSKGFRGTPQDLERLQSGLMSRIVRNEFPNHRVFIIGSQVVGAISLDAEPGTSTYSEQYSALNRSLADRRMTTFNCAMIVTGRGERVPLI